MDERWRRRRRNRRRWGGRAGKWGRRKWAQSWGNILREVSQQPTLHDIISFSLPLFCVFFASVGNVLQLLFSRLRRAHRSTCFCMCFFTFFSLRQRVGGSAGRAAGGPESFSQPTQSHWVQRICGFCYIFWQEYALTLRVWVCLARSLCFVVKLESEPLCLFYIFNFISKP